MGSYASVNGFMYFARGVGAVVGSPVGGVILGSGGNVGLRGGGGKSWRSVVCFDAALLIGAAVCVIGVRVLSAVDRREWRWKA